jgi:hypothetical protein
MHNTVTAAKHLVIVLFLSTAAARAAAMSTKTTAIFSYGSNSMTQLRGRVHNPTLQSQPAYLDGWSRIFCSRGLWGNGGVASLAPCPGARTYGALAYLSDDELARLNVYEAGYTLTPLDTLFCGDVRTPAFAYISDTPTFQQAPAEPYLTAIRIMLSEHYSDAIVDSIPICRVAPPTSGGTSEVSVVVEQLCEWRHPGVENLQLDSLCVEVNSLRRKSPWKMPAMAYEITGKLASVGITTTRELVEALKTVQGRQQFASLFDGDGGGEDGEASTLSLFQSTLRIEDRGA